MELDHNGWALKNGCFQIVMLEKTLESPLNSKEINQSVLKEINPEYSLEGLMLKLKLQNFGHMMQRWLTGKDPDAGKNWGQEEKGMTEDEMVEYYHWLNGHELGQTHGDREGQGGLVCCSPRGTKNWMLLSDWPTTATLNDEHQVLHALGWGVKDS